MRVDTAQTAGENGDEKLGLAVYTPCFPRRLFGRAGALLLLLLREVLVREVMRTRGLAAVLDQAVETDQRL